MEKALVFLMCVAAVLAQEVCDPNTNCKLPNCRCFVDSEIPGGLNAAEVPQMVLVTMDYTVNEEYQQLYDQFFNVNNPNGCPVTGTFFIQDLSTNYEVVKSYYDKNFEIGIQSLDGTTPTTGQQWLDVVKNVKSKLVTAGVDAKDIRGFRAPELAPGGNDEFIAIGDEDLLYDAGCVTSAYDEEETYKWPFTLDFPEKTNICNSGKSADIRFPGKWQVMVADLSFNGTKCASPQSCPGVLTKKDAFDLLYNNFVQHYEGKKAPYVIVIDPVWVKTDFKLEGLIQFVDYIRAAFDDTWVLTVYQALQWIQDPTPTANITDFAPWKCT